MIAGWSVTSPTYPCISSGLITTHGEARLTRWLVPSPLIVMRTLFEPTTVDDVQARLHRLEPRQQRLCGTITVAQALPHCSAALSMAPADRRPPRVLIVRVLG